MRERGILFSGSMVRALMANEKTQTRRVIQPQPMQGASWDDAAKLFVLQGSALGVLRNCPYGSLGDLLYVRESVAIRNQGSYDDAKKPDEHGHRQGWYDLLYKADDPFRTTTADIRGYTYRPSIFMPKWCTRIWLKITGLGVQRLQDISRGDAVAEGVSDTQLYTAHATGLWEEFQVLWDTLNAPRGYGWDVNPWVWVVTFQRVER